ncbi:MAG: cyclic pyranopterin monophosphate synthase MoaC [bacterium]|jgi:cyclic pyranopterin phosphate synthase|nr:cyclic pyranopterin monophosphate synthase MoaC [bacterium]
MEGLSHLDPDGRPAMVDVGGKPVTARRALAEGRVRLPAAVAALLRDGELDSPKGPVLHTAILAGTMAAKRTAELIPLCHPLPLERVRLSIQVEAGDEGCAVALLRCEAALHGRTGVEMEALTGVAVAALTIVDMCKALSHELVIDGIRLLEKEGGRRTVRDGRLVPA